MQREKKYSRRFLRDERQKMTDNRQNKTASSNKFKVKHKTIKQQQHIDIHLNTDYKRRSYIFTRSFFQDYQHVPGDRNLVINTAIDTVVRSSLPLDLHCSDTIFQSQSDSLHDESACSSFPA